MNGIFGVSHCGPLKLYGVLLRRYGKYARIGYVTRHSEQYFNELKYCHIVVCENVSLVQFVIPYLRSNTVLMIIDSELSLSKIVHLTGIVKGGNGLSSLDSRVRLALSDRPGSDTFGTRPIDPQGEAIQEVRRLSVLDKYNSLGYAGRGALRRILRVVGLRMILGTLDITEARKQIEDHLGRKPGWHKPFQELAEFLDNPGLLKLRSACLKASEIGISEAIEETGADSYEVNTVLRLAQSLDIKIGGNTRKMVL